jgi:signal transduction histidine kinase
MVVMDLSGRARGWVPLLLAIAAAFELAGRLRLRSSQEVGAPNVHAVTAIYLSGSPGRHSAQALVMLFVLCLLMTLPLALPEPVAACLVITTATMVSLTVFHVLFFGGLCAQLAAVYRLGRRGPGRAEWLPAVLTVPFVVPFVVLAVAGIHGLAERVIIVLLVALAPAAAVLGVAQRRSAAAAAVAEEAVAGTVFEYMARGERTRIARELHDVVAHHISMIAVQAETARLTTPEMPELGRRRLREIGDTARAGLTEMRRLLGVLREDALSAEEAVSAAGTVPDAAVAAARRADRRPQPGLPQLNELIDEARDASGAGVRFIVSGAVAALEPGVELAVYRIVQEALTNARRHAPGAAVDVELRFGSDALRLGVRDDGPGTSFDVTPGAGVAGGAGHGLLGMRERAQAVGGELHAGPAADGGFLVAAVLPVTAQPTEAAV